MTMLRGGFRWNHHMRFFALFLIIGASLPAFSQLGGSYTYQYLLLPNSARVAALGGVNVSAMDGDVTTGWMNPALLNAGMHNVLSVNHAIRAGNINHGYVAYARSGHNPEMTFHTGLLYNTYGTLGAFDENGNPLGSFKASEYALTGGLSYRADKLSCGINARLLYGQLESYNSLGIALDIGGAYADTVRRLYAGVVLKHIGTQFISYTPGNREALPFELQMGISKRLQYLPLQVSLTAHNMQQFDIRYADPSDPGNQNIFAADTNGGAEEELFIGDKILRHLVLAGEFYFGSNLRVRAGYDFMQQRELILDTRRGLTGFSLGFGVIVKKYSIDYGYEITSLAGGNHYFSISTDLDFFGKR